MERRVTTRRIKLRCQEAAPPPLRGRLHKGPLNKGGGEEKKEKHRKQHKNRKRKTWPPKGNPENKGK